MNSSSMDEAVRNWPITIDILLTFDRDWSISYSYQPHPYCYCSL